LPGPLALGCTDLGIDWYRRSQRDGKLRDLIQDRRPERRSSPTRSASSTSTSLRCARRKASSLFIDINRTSKIAFALLREKANTATAVAFLDEVIEATPYKVNMVLTDNGIRFADLPKKGSRPTAT
jgi:hypothetical protein